MASSKRPFPKKQAVIAAASLPFWYAFFVSRGWPPKMVAGACTLGLAVVLVALYVPWHKTNQKADGHHRKPDEE